MKSGGFTLIELLVVTLVMAALLATAAPSVARSYRHWSGDFAVDRFIQTTEYARERAIIVGAPIQLSVERGDGRVLLKTRGENGELVPLEDRWGRGFRLPEGLSLRAEPSEIDFMPNGTATPATLHFQSLDGARRTFDLQPLLGKMHEDNGE